MALRPTTKKRFMLIMTLLGGNRVTRTPISHWHRQRSPQSLQIHTAVPLAGSGHAGLGSGSARLSGGGVPGPACAAATAAGLLLALVQVGSQAQGHAAQQLAHEHLGRRLRYARVVACVCVCVCVHALGWHMRTHT